MQKIKYEFVFYYITVATMTALSFASLLLLREVLIFKYCADASLSVYGKIQGGIEDILSAVWGSDFSGELKTVDVNIRRLRIKIESDPTEPEFITTVWGYGYKWGF